MNNEKDIILKVDHLSQHFKIGNKILKAVDDVSFEIKKGEVFGLVGESGCGKTTTGRTIIKLYDATDGSVYFKNNRIVAGYKASLKKIKTKLRDLKKQEKKESDEEKKKELSLLISKTNLELEEALKAALIAKNDHKNCDKIYIEQNVKLVNEEIEKALEGVTDKKEIAKIKESYAEKLNIAKKDKLVTKIQMIFQDPIASLDPRMTVREIIAEGLIIKGYKNQEVINEMVYEVLEMVGLVREHASRYPHEFSGGQRQRIGIARAIIMKPELIIADEPISALDVSIQAQVINLLNDLRKKLGLTILFIAHDLSVVKYFSDWIGVMYYGKMVERGRSEEIFKNPLHPYTKSLLSAIPLPDPEYEKRRKRIIYNPLADHDYSTQAPTFREVSPDHFVMCNDIEFEKYKKELLDNANAK